MISFSYNFLFVHVPKTGGNSLQDVLRPYAADHIVVNGEHQDGVERFELRNPLFRDLHKHSPLIAYRKVLPKDQYRNLFKFSITRNPWERMISLYFTPSLGATSWDRDAFIRLLKATPPLSFFVTTPIWAVNLLSPRCWQRLCQLNFSSQLGRRLSEEIDFFLRFDHLDADFSEVCKHLGLPSLALSVRNKGGGHQYADYYDKELIELVRRNFQEEIALMGYKFKDSSA